MVETDERALEILVAVYKMDMEKIANKMQSVEDYIELADLYEESAGLIRKLDKDMKELNDGRE